jgi:hypothetical protein
MPLTVIERDRLMPEFFIPENTPRRSEELYQWILRYVTAMLDCQIDPVRIYSLDYARGGHQFKATVGEIEPRTGQLVMAILRSNAFLICTPYYGVRRGEPLSVDFSELCAVQYFEGLDNAREKLGLAVRSLDASADAIQSRLQSAAAAIATVGIGDFPPAMVPDFLSLKYKLTWQGDPGVTVGRMGDAEAEAAAAAIKALYVDTFRTASERESRS